MSTTFRLGKLPAQPARPHLKLSAVLAERLIAPPASCDWQADAIVWPMYGNDQIGDCTCAGVGHMVNQLTFYGGGTEQRPVEASVVAMYSAITGYTPAKPSSDTGAYCQDVLGYWRKTGLEGHKAAAYASLDVSNLVEVKQAISLFGSVYVGMNFPDSAMDQFNAGQTWDVKRGAHIEGGHCVMVGAYSNGTFGLVTWGAETEMTEAFWKKYVDEAWAVLDEDGLNKAAAYFTGAASFHALGGEFAALTGETNPIPAPQPQYDDGSLTMATPMTAAQVITQLKKWGLKYVEIPGWATHNRAGHGAWGPINGFIWHHTGADVSNASAKSYAGSTLYDGITDLPGPLCHFSIGLDGTVYLVGWGRANHAGGGDPVTLQHVINEDYAGQLHPTKGNTTGVDGNAHFYGVEIQYSGGHEMAAAQYAAALRLSAAVLDFHVERDGWSKDAEAVIAHGEWSSDKWDPGYAPGKIMAMPGVRADVKTTLAASPTQETDMTPDQAAQLKAVRDNLLVITSLTEKDAKGVAAKHGAGYFLAHIQAQLVAVQATEAAQTAALTALASAIGKVDAAVDVPALVAEVKAAIEAAVSQVVIHLDVPDAT